MARTNAAAPGTASTVDRGRELIGCGGAIDCIASPNKSPVQVQQIQYALRLVVLPGTNGPRALRRALKYIGRYCGLKATSVERVRQ